jgi:hypothetical protein
MRFPVACSLVLISVHAAGASREELTVKQAASLVHVVVEHQLKSVGRQVNFALDPMLKRPDRRFFSFEALGNFHSDRPGSAVIGNYAVDRRTGEVWNLDSCRRIEFRALLHARRKLVSGDISGGPTPVPPTC